MPPFAAGWQDGDMSEISSGGAPSPAWCELREAATEILEFGQHEGPCTNGTSRDEPCEVHLRHMEERKARLLRALEAAGP
jgi:hypothetical protein